MHSRGEGSLSKREVSLQVLKQASCCSTQPAYPTLNPRGASAGATRFRYRIALLWHYNTHTQHQCGNLRFPPVFGRAPSASRKGYWCPPRRGTQGASWSKKQQFAPTAAGWWLRSSTGRADRRSEPTASRRGTRSEAHLQDCRLLQGDQLRGYVWEHAWK